MISVNSIGNEPDELSMTKLTSARPRAGRSGVPANTTSSILPDLTVVGPWAPNTHATASTTLDLPLPFGPTTTVTPGSNSSTVGSAKDLKPFMVSDFRNTIYDLSAGQEDTAGNGTPTSCPLVGSSWLTLKRYLRCLLEGRIRPDSRSNGV